jgi:hypothetical protein
MTPAFEDIEYKKASKGVLNPLRGFEWAYS